MDPLCTAKTLWGIIFCSLACNADCIGEVRLSWPVGNSLKGDPAVLKDVQVCLNMETHAEKHTPGSLDAEHSAVESHII